MRDAFIDELTALARDDDRIVVVSADIGNHMFDRFRETFPRRFVNAGIAEADMTGIAAGLALAGFRPFTYTIAAFNPGRCLEQIRLDICQHRLPVTVVGTGAGLSYASLGPTHHALEDIAWMRTLPGMSIVCPGDVWEVRAAVRAAAFESGPVYLRLGKKGEPAVHAAMPTDFRIGKARRLRAGAGAAILAVGTLLPEALAAAERLAERGVEAAVYSFHTPKPLDADLLEELFAAGGPRLVAVAEEHVPAGGTWGAVAEWLVERGTSHVPLLRLGAADAFIHEAGNQEWTRKRLGLSADGMAERILATLSDTESGGKGRG